MPFQPLLVPATRRRRQLVTVSLAATLVLGLGVLAAGGWFSGAGRESCTASPAIAGGSQGAPSARAALEEWQRRQSQATPRWGWLASGSGSSTVTYRSWAYSVEVVEVPAHGWHLGSVTQPC